MLIRELASVGWGIQSAQGNQGGQKAATWLRIKAAACDASSGHIEVNARDCSPERAAAVTETTYYSHPISVSLVELNLAPAHKSHLSSHRPQTLTGCCNELWCLAKMPEPLVQSSTHRISLSLSYSITHLTLSGPALEFKLDLDQNFIVGSPSVVSSKVPLSLDLDLVTWDWITR